MTLNTPWNPTSRRDLRDQRMDWQDHYDNAKGDLEDSHDAMAADPHNETLASNHRALARHYNSVKSWFNWIHHPNRDSEAMTAERNAYAAPRGGVDAVAAQRQEDYEQEQQQQGGGGQGQGGGGQGQGGSHHWWAGR